MGLELTGLFIVTEVKSKTKRQMFKDLKVNDVLKVRQKLESQGTGSNGTYATRIKVEKDFETYHFTLNEFGAGMSSVELKQIK